MGSPDRQGMGIIAGTTPIPEFFASENIGRIVGAARAEVAP